MSCFSYFLALSWWCCCLKWHPSSVYVLYVLSITKDVLYWDSTCFRETWFWHVYSEVDSEFKVNEYIVYEQLILYLYKMSINKTHKTRFRSDQISRSVVSDSLWPHESQHARPPCPSPTPRVHSDSRPSSQWCHPAISSSVVPFSSCPQSLCFSCFWSKKSSYSDISTCISDFFSWLSKSHYS